MRSEVWNDLQGRLQSYKATHKKSADAKGKTAELNQARTLTQARKAVYGEKQKEPNCGGCNHKQNDCCKCTSLI